MTLALDPEFAEAIAPFAQAMAALPRLPQGDIAGRRERFTQHTKVIASRIPKFENITRTDHPIPTADGATITLAEFRSSATPTDTPPTKCIYYIHGGGMFLGSVDSFASTTSKRTQDTGVPTFSIDYRLAPENPHPIPVNDCYAGLQWLHANAAKLNIDPAKIIVLGESAGGGLAATTLMARDKSLSPPILKQILIYPMLDDRTTTPDPSIEPYAMWRTPDNITGWTALIGPSAGSADPDAVPYYAAPARAKDLANLPPTFIECGQLDIFVHENIEYAARLARAGVPVELHVYPGMPHGFQFFAPESGLAKGSVVNVKRAVLDA